MRPQDKVELVTALKAKGAVSRWPAMASTMRRRSRPPTSASPWARAPTWRCPARHVTLVKGDLRGIARARQLSQATVSNMKQNLGFALVYNALGVPIAAGVLYPFFGVLLSPMIAALAMSLSSVSVVGNALAAADEVMQ